MDDLLTINDDNIGGIQLLRFAPRYFFSSLDPANLVFKPGFDWIKIEIISQTGSIDHDSVPDDAGDHYNITAAALLPRERSEVDLILYKFRGLPCLVRITDQNGNDRLTGHTPGELLLGHSSSTGEAASDANGYKINFKGKQLSKAVFL